MIGVFSKVLSEVPEHTLALEKGDRLLFYTDGLTEATEAPGKALGTEGLARIASESLGAGLFEMADDILDRIRLNDLGTHDDDKTLIVAQIK
jgi:serine phosphatase RsbU (regulator of sigma subunit)